MNKIIGKLKKLQAADRRDSQDRRQPMGQA
jgi:hypothetical protein